MALEDRVKQLEEELNVLKNEIQTTLLDIQEHLLTNRYASLYPSSNSNSNPVNPVARTEDEPKVIPVAIVPAEMQPQYQANRVFLTDESEEVEPQREAPTSLPNESPLNTVAKPPSGQNGDQQSEQGPQPDSQAKWRNNPLLTKTDPIKDAAETEDVLDEDEKQFFASLAEESAATNDLGLSFLNVADLLPRKTTDSTGQSDTVSDQILDELLAETFVREAENKGPSSQSEEREKPYDSPALKRVAKVLLSWIDESVSLIGHKRTEQAIDWYVQAGEISKTLREPLKRLVRSSEATPPDETPNIKTIITTFGKMNEVLDNHSAAELSDVIDLIMEINFG